MAHHEAVENEAAEMNTGNVTSWDGGHTSMKGVKGDRGCDAVGGSAEERSSAAMAGCKEESWHDATTSDGDENQDRAAGKHERDPGAPSRRGAALGRLWTAKELRRYLRSKQGDSRVQGKAVDG